ncbi:MAG: hypothetical protein ACRD4Q_00155 [Candidatus Acidiferrales bacterium]
MKIRDVYLVNGQTLNDSDTVNVDLTRSLKILKLRIQYRNKNGATSNTVGRLNGMVSKMAVVDGSNVIHSLSMREEQAKNFFDCKKMPFQQLSQAGGGEVIEEAIIDFRRYEGDTGFYLDTSEFINPQLQLTHSFTVSGTAGFVTANGELSVIATVIDSGAPTQAGYMMAKELSSFATQSSGDHSLDLPLDYPIGALLVQTAVDGDTPDTFFSNFKLTQDTDSFIPINMAYTDLLYENLNRFGKGEQLQTVLNATTGTLKGDLYFQTAGIVAQAGATAKALITVQTANESTLAMTTSETGVVSGKMEGSAPHGTAIYQFGDGEDPAEIFQPSGVGKFQLILTQAGTGATAKVVVVQQHP